jgi:hypothetical protein
VGCPQKQSVAVVRRETLCSRYTSHFSHVAEFYDNAGPGVQRSTPSVCMQSLARIKAAAKQLCKVRNIDWPTVLFDCDGVLVDTEKDGHRNQSGVRAGADLHRGESRSMENCWKLKCVKGYRLLRNTPSKSHICPSSVIEREVLSRYACTQNGHLQKMITNERCSCVRARQGLSVRFCANLCWLTVDHGVSPSTCGSTLDLAFV